MAKKVTGYIKLQIPAGKATPAPPVGPALGQHGVNIVQFTKEFNARTAAVSYTHLILRRSAKILKKSLGFRQIKRSFFMLQDCK